MNVRDIRLRNLLAIRDRDFAGVQAALARALDVRPAQLSQWVHGQRTITEDSARAIEDRLRMPVGGLDWPDGPGLIGVRKIHTSVQDDSPEYQITPDERALIEKYRAAPESGKRTLHQVGDALAQPAQQAVDMKGRAG